MVTCLLVHPGAELFGADRMLYESAMAVQGAGRDVVVALAETGPLVTALESKGIRTVVVTMFVLRKALLRPKNWPELVSLFARGMVASWRLVSRIKPTSIYVSTVTLPQWPLLARLRRIPAVTHVHEAEGAASRWVNFAIYLPHLLSKRVLVNSHFSLATIRRSLPVLARRSRIVDNGVAGPPASPSPPRQRLDGLLKILFLGRLSPRKGPDLIIEAARELLHRGINVSVVLAGSTFRGYEWYESELREAIHSAGLVEEEVLVGFQESIWPLLEDCDVLVVPSRLDEPFGNTAVEGVLAHRPIIVSDTTGLREAAAGYITAQWVERDNPVALADALQRLVVDWDNVGGQVQNSAEKALNRHDPSVYRQRINEAIDELVTPTSTTRR